MKFQMKKDIRECINICDQQKVKNKKNRDEEKEKKGRKNIQKQGYEEEETNAGMGQRVSYKCKQLHLTQMFILFNKYLEIPGIIILKYFS